MTNSSAFKSSSRRGTRDSGGNSDYNHVPKAPPVRKRSQSVSSSSRTKQQLDISSDFSNKIENPLFSSSPTYLEGRGVDDTIESTVKRNGSYPIEKIEGINGDRGRSTTRSDDCGVRKGIGRSLSRVRGGSVSRGYVYESEKDLDMAIADTKFTNLKLADSFGNGSDMYGRISNSSTKKYSEADSEDIEANWEMGTSISFQPEVEDRTIKHIHEQNQPFGAYLSECESGMSGISETVRSEVRRALSEVQDDLESAIQRKKVGYIATRNIAETPPDLVNPGAVELVLDIRRAYSLKLEESEERARKLREDLAVEELRGEELSRILTEVLPHPKVSNPQKSRQGRKRSTERKTNSKRLTEEAMAYFEDCVSISTFDSSDFSAPGEPAHFLAAAPSIHVGPHEKPIMNLPPYTPSCSKSNQQMECNQDEFSHSCDESKLSASSYEHTAYNKLCKDKGVISNQHPLFSFDQETNEDLELRDIDRFLSNCKREKSVDIDIDILCSDSKVVSRRYDAVDYNGGIDESLVFDRVLFRNSVEYGGLHLCGGSVSIPYSLFGGSCLL